MDFFLIYLFLYILMHLQSLKQDKVVFFQCFEKEWTEGGSRNEEIIENEQTSYHSNHWLKQHNFDLGP